MKLFLFACQRKYVQLFFLFISLILVSDCEAQFSYSFEFNPKSRSVRIPFEMRNNLIIIKIKINQSDTLNFILDTGLRFNLVTDPQVASSLGLKFTRKFNIVGFGENDPITASISLNNKIDLSGVVGHNQNLVALSEDKLELSDFVGMPIHGVLGFDIFGSFVVKVDFSSREITLIDPLKYKYKKRQGQKLPMSIEEGKPYVLASYTNEANKEVPLKLILDTGAGHGLLLETASNPDIQLPERTIFRQLGKGLNGIIYGQEGRISCFRIGNYNIDQVITSFPDTNSKSSQLLKSTNRQGNLGCEVMSRFNIIFNYQQGYLVLHPNKKEFRKPFERDMSGMVVSTRGTDFNSYFVDNVYVGSPAQKAGVKRGDEILMVDFRTVDYLKLSGINQKLTKGDGKKIVLLLRRDNELIKVEFDLKKMI